MPAQNTSSLNKGRKINTFFLCFCMALLSMYPIYRNFYYSSGILSYERQIAILEKRSEFYNPWQYRILCPYTIEGMLWVYNRTVDRVYPIEKKLHASPQDNTDDKTGPSISGLEHTPGAIKYIILFVLFRFAEDLFIFYLSWRLWNYFVKSQWLIFFGINFLAIALGNSVTGADLSFNTYMDIILYLLTANIIVYNKNPLWLFLIVPLGALNRETSVLIPALYLISKTDFTHFSFKKFNVRSISFPKTNIWLMTAALYIIFFSIFIALRWHFGYRPPEVLVIPAQQIWVEPSGWLMLKVNLFSGFGVKTYFELIGIFGVIPFIILYKFRSFPYLLKKWFLFLVPVWFAVHYIAAVAHETRLFMVPVVLTFFPMILWLIENEIQGNSKSSIA